MVGTTFIILISLVIYIAVLYYLCFETEYDTPAQARRVVFWPVFILIGSVNKFIKLVLLSFGYRSNNKGE